MGDPHAPLANVIMLATQPDRRRSTSCGGMLKPVV